MTTTSKPQTEITLMTQARAAATARYDEMKKKFEREADHLIRVICLLCEGKLPEPSDDGRHPVTKLLSILQKEGKLPSELPPEVLQLVAQLDAQIIKMLNSRSAPLRAAILKAEVARIAIAHLSTPVRPVVGLKSKVLEARTAARAYDSLRSELVMSRELSLLHAERDLETAELEVEHLSWLLDLGGIVDTIATFVDNFAEGLGGYDALRETLGLVEDDESAKLSQAFKSAFENIRRGRGTKPQAEDEDGPGTFDYEAMDTTGTDCKGTIDADSEAAAMASLKSQDLFVTKLLRRQQAGA